jgi:hypothetical protein
MIKFGQRIVYEDSSLYDLKNTFVSDKKKVGYTV